METANYQKEVRDAHMCQDISIVMSLKEEEKCPVLMLGFRHVKSSKKEKIYVHKRNYKAK